MKNYVDAEKLQEYTTKLVAKLKEIFPGPAQAASTVAEMTDESKVYVYTGSETGYTAGNWYYWNGTAWTSGGVYNAVQIETDTTLTETGEAADAKATGDAIAAAKAAVLADLAPAYSTSATYAVGAYVVYNGGLYRCITAISTAEAWTAAHWTAVDLANDVGASLADLKSAFLNSMINTLNISQGYYAIADGTKVDSANWCRSALTFSDFSIKTTNPIFALLLAYDKSGNYVGAWTGNDFSKVFDYTTQLKSYINVNEVASVYKDYVFVLDFYKGGSPLAPQDVVDALTYTKAFTPFDVSAKVTSVGVLTFFPVKSGETFVISSLSDENLPATAKVNVYDSNGEYLSYFGTAGLKSRTIVSPLNFEYAAVVDTPNINMLIQKQEAFGETSYRETLETIGQHQSDINALRLNTKTYKKEITEASALIAKYGGDNNPTVCDARFMWITDMHGEINRTAHFAKLASEFGTTMIPFVLNTGDTVSNVMSDGIAWYNNIVSEMSVPVLNMVGNHDAYVTNGVLASDKRDVYNEIISPFVSDWGVISPTNAAENGYCYYYKELSTDIRLIVLDCMYWDAAQKTWFDNVLSDALTNSKHVIVAVHAPFASSYCTLVDSVWNTGWLSRDSTITSIDAMESVQSFINNGGVFIAWLQGHVHGDEIVTVDSGKQLAICNNSFSNRGTKVPKLDDANAYNYNSYTIVAIDANLHYLKLYRIGADISVSGRKHNGFVWDYTNRTIVADW